MPHSSSTPRPSLRSRLIATAAAVACATGFAATTAAAASIDATGSVSSTSISRNSTLTAKGSATYRPDFMGYVIPMKGFIQQTYSYSRFNRPSVVSTNWGNSPLFFKAADDFSGATVWRASDEFQFFGELTVSQTSKATASTPGSATIRYGTGKGHAFDRNAWNYITIRWARV
jgi:hypothetical protein